jgi:hypothetical protein
LDVFVFVFNKAVNCFRVDQALNSNQYVREYPSYPEYPDIPGIPFTSVL